VVFEDLTREREASLARRAVAGDSRSRDALVNGCLPAVAAMARRYRGSPTIGREELIQAGVMGLLRALRRYDPARGTPFWGYALWWVRQAMQQVVAELAYPVVLSDRALRELAMLHRAQRTYGAAHGSEPSMLELASECGLAPEHVSRLLAVERVPGPLDSASSGDDDAFESVERQLASEQLRSLPGDLGEREREVLRAHFGLGRPSRTLEQIAVALGVSAERVRQIEARALEKVRGVALAPTPPAATVPRRPGTSAATPARSGGRARR
jgi:RNA polymerase sigma factor (sigma-70 family)